MSSYYNNKKVVIMGLGIHGGGLGAARFMAKAGARVLVTDLKSAADLKESIIKLRDFKNIEYVLGEHRFENFENADLIIQNPAVHFDSPYLEAARKKGVFIDTDIGIFFENCPAPIIGVTGSKGKSTTAALITEVLKQKFSRVFLGGNIRISVLDILSQIKSEDIAVLELSSWQLEGLIPHKKSPTIAVLTNIFKEHLDRYKNFKDYQRAKELIFKWQTAKDYLIIHKDLSGLESLKAVKSEVIFYDGENKEAARLIGEIYGISHNNIDKVTRNFSGLEGRFKKFLEKDGMIFINDTCATHPQAAIRALKKLNGQPIILIAGGDDKNLEFDELNQEIEKRVKALIVLPGTASIKITPAVRTIKANNMEEAVRVAKKEAQNGDFILLSPAAASFTPLLSLNKPHNNLKSKPLRRFRPKSNLKERRLPEKVTGFNLFKHEFDRGKQFIALIKKYF